MWSDSSAKGLSSQDLASDTRLWIKSEVSIVWGEVQISLRLLRLGRLYIGVVGCFALQKHPLLDLVCPRFHPLSSIPPLLVWRLPSWLMCFLTRDCHLGHEVVRTVEFCHFLLVYFITNSSIFPISPFLVKTVIDVLFFSLDNGSLIRVFIYHL